jgi:uncharacterized RDD family membrane protein YckC
MSGLTPGDPLGGEAPERPRHGYVDAPPPGAGGPVPAFGGPVAAGRPVLAGWWRRVGAALIDGFIVSIGAAILFVAITAPFSIGFFANDTVGVVAVIGGALIAVLCVAVVSLLYAPALMARTDGRTLGRSALGIRVIRADGQRMTFALAFVREVLIKALLVGVISSLTFGIAYFVDVLWPLWDEENRALHDFVVNTRVVVD